MRLTATAIRAFVLAAALAPACAAVDRAASTAGAATHEAQSATDFTPRRVIACLRRGPTSMPGVVLIDRYSDDGRALVYFTMMQTDYGLPGVTIVFARSRADASRVQRAAHRGARLRRRANVVFYWSRSTPSEFVRIVDRCLGGRR